MSRRRERPLTTALGWRLPWWLLDFGPVAFIFLVGVAALGTVHAAGSGPRVPLFLGLVAATGGLLVRHRAPLIVLGLTLAIELALGWVSTGRSRLALFGVRLPAAGIVTLCLSAAAYALVLVATFVFADGTPTPGVGLILQGAAWIALANVVVVALSVGVGSLTGSRALTLTAVIGWQAIVTNLLVNVSSLGSVRDALLTPALTQIMPLKGGGDMPVLMATGIAVLVIGAWLVVPQLVGGWRTQTRDA